MGKAGIPLFGDNTKAQIEKKIVKIDQKIAKLQKIKSDLRAAVIANETIAKN